MFTDLIAVIVYLEKANKAKVLGITATLIEVAWVRDLYCCSSLPGIIAKLSTSWVERALPSWSNVVLPHPDPAGSINNLNISKVVIIGKMGVNKDQKHPPMPKVALSAKSKHRNGRNSISHPILKEFIECKFTLLFINCCIW